MKSPSKTSLVIWSLLLWGVWSAADYYGETEYLTRSRNAYYRVTVNLDYQDKPVELKAVVKCRISNMRELGGALRSGFGAAPEVVGKRLDDGSGLFILPSKSNLCKRVYREDGLTFDVSYETVFLTGVPRTYWVKDFAAQNYAEVYFSKSSYTDPEAKFKNAKVAISTATREDYQIFRKQKDVIIRDQDEELPIPLKNIYCFFALNIQDDSIFQKSAQLQSLLLQTADHEQDKTIAISPDEELRKLVWKSIGGSDGNGPRILGTVLGSNDQIIAGSDKDLQRLIDDSLLPFQRTNKKTFEPRPASKIVSCFPRAFITPQKNQIDFEGLSLRTVDYQSKYYVNLKNKLIIEFFDYDL